MFLLTFHQVLKMCIVLIIGFICFKTGVVDETGSRTLSNLLLLIVNPILIFQSFLTEGSDQLVREFALAALLAALSYAIVIPLSTLLFRKNPGADKHIEQFSVIYTNCGFMGIPLINALLGSRGVLFLTPYMVIFNILVWTHGVSLMTGSFDRKQMLRGMTSPVFFAIGLGLIFFLGGLSMPVIMNDALTYVASMNTPLAMLIAGAALAQSSPVKMLKNPRIYLVTFLRLVFFPLLLLLLSFRLPVNRDILCVILVACACPSATTCTMFSLRFNQNHRYASEIFTFSTIISMVTIPAYVYLLERILFPLIAQ